jgi:hypothetical protein
VNLTRRLAVPLNIIFYRWKLQPKKNWLRQRARWLHRREVIPSMFCGNGRSEDTFGGSCLL